MDLLLSLSEDMLFVGLAAGLYLILLGFYLRKRRLGKLEITHDAFR
ncbi:MAG: hypothetical protein V1834_00110 [Candidatus Micrarchaeota archaeon]